MKLKRSNTTGSTTGARPSKKTLLLRWCQKVTEEYDVRMLCDRFGIQIPLVFIVSIFLLFLLQNVSIRNFSDSFSDGLAFCAIVHHFSPTRIPYHLLNSKTRVRLTIVSAIVYCMLELLLLQEKNFQVAFDAAEAEGIPRLLVGTV